MHNIKPESIIADGSLTTGNLSRLLLAIGLLKNYKNSFTLIYILDLDWCCSEVIAIQKR